MKIDGFRSVWKKRSLCKTLNFYYEIALWLGSTQNSFKIDLAAEKVIAATKNNRKIAVEIKSLFFLRPFIGRIIAEHQLNLLIFDRNKEDIILWKD